MADIRFKLPHLINQITRIGNNIWFVDMEVAVLCGFDLVSKKIVEYKRIPKIPFNTVISYYSIVQYKERYLLLVPFLIPPGSFIVYDTCNEKFISFGIDEVCVNSTEKKLCFYSAIILGNVAYYFGYNLGEIWKPLIIEFDLTNWTIELRKEWDDILGKIVIPKGSQFGLWSAKTADSSYAYIPITKTNYYLKLERDLIEIEKVDEGENVSSCFCYDDNLYVVTDCGLYVENGNKGLIRICSGDRFIDYAGGRPLNDKIFYTKYDKPEIDIYGLSDGMWKTVSFSNRMDYSRTDLALPRMEVMLQWNGVMICFSYLSRDLLFIDKDLNILFENKIYLDYENINIQYDDMDLSGVQLIHEGRPGYLDLTMFIDVLTDFNGGLYEYK